MLFKLMMCRKRDRCAIRNKIRGGDIFVDIEFISQNVFVFQKNFFPLQPLSSEKRS